MSQKTLFTKSARSRSGTYLHPGLVGRLSVKRIFFLWPGPGLFRKVQLPMMQVTLAVTPH